MQILFSTLTFLWSMVKFWFFGNADLINIFVSFGQYLSRYRENSVRIMSFYVLRCWPDNIAEKKFFFFSSSFFKPWSPCPCIVILAGATRSPYRSTRKTKNAAISSFFKISFKFLLFWIPLTKPHIFYVSEIHF
jgi:hypothetical protein